MVLFCPHPHMPVVAAGYMAAGSSSRGWPLCKTLNLPQPMNLCGWPSAN